MRTARVGSYILEYRATMLKIVKLTRIGNNNNERLSSQRLTGSELGSSISEFREFWICRLT